MTSPEGVIGALAVLDDNFDDDTADLVLLSLDVEVGEAEGAVVGAVTVTGDNVDMSMATDLATVKNPTRDFQSAPAGGGTDDNQSDSLSVLAVMGLGAAALALAVPSPWRSDGGPKPARDEGRYS